MDNILEDDSKAKNLLAEACEKEGLDCAYWLPKLSEKLGVKSREALKHLQYEDYLKLECEVRYPWEKQALQKLLEITEDKGSSEDLQKERLEMTKKRQEEAKQLLEELKEMRKSRNQSEDIRRQKEKALWKAMEIPKEYWPLPEKSLLDVLESIQKQLEQQESSVGRGENVSDTEVLRRASGGLALQGIYKTSRVDDVLAKRDQIIRIPDGFKLTGPEQGSLIERKEFSSSAEEAAFTKSMEQLGFSISVCAKAGFWGFNTEDDYSSSSRSEATCQSHSEQSYICTTKFQYIPLASCYFQKHQLCLSKVALRELQDIENLLSITPEGEESNSMKSRCGSFFSRFGSHVNQGPLHFGGIFWWKAATEGFQAEQREEMKQQASKALNSYIGATYSNFTTSVGGDVEVSQSSLQSSVQGRDGKSAHRGVQLYVTSTGGPAGTDSLPQWKSGLVANNSTWRVIDRGFQLIPVWDLILSNHSKDFKSPYQVSSSLRAAYEALTNQSASPMFGEELVSAVEEARDFMEHVKGWDVTVGEEKLLELINFKQRLNEKTKNHIVWVNVCLSDKALQEFLGNIVGFCKSSPPDNITYIKSLLRCLLDPHIYSVKDFPSSSSIMQWIFHTKKTLPKTPDISELEDLTKTLLQMKDYIQEVTYAPETSASAVHEAKIKATLTASLAIYSLLQCLQERAQKDVELLVLLITTSMGYRVESSTFQYLLGCPEITFMTTEMQTGHQEYLNLKKQDLYRAQAHLLLKGLTVTPEQKAVSLEQKKERLVFMEDHMKNLWSAEITTLLEKHRALKDWEMLESGLKALISGHLDDTCDEAKDDSKAKNLLAEACEKEGLDCAYWLPKLSEKLGVKSREALKHLQYEDYLKLECEVRYPWEKQALQKLLEITEDKGSSEDLQKERLEMIKKRQEEAKQLLEELKEMRKSRNQSEDIRRQKEKALWKAMEIPKEYWPLPEKSLLDVLESIQKQLEQQESSVGRGENVSDTEVLRRASGGLALQGIYKTSRVDDVLAKRDQIIRVPDGFKLTGPEQGSLIERKEFSSSAEEASFSKSMEQLGFSISVCAKAGFWGFNTEDDYSSSSRSEATCQSHSEQGYICTTKFQYIPLASCYFQKHQLCLSEAALRELQDIEHLLSIPPEGEESNSMKTRCESFFRTFGSHVNQGPLHFGGIFWWKAATEGFRAEQREEMKQQASKALNSYIGATYSNFTTSVGGDVEVSQSSLQSSVQGRDGKSAHRGVQLYVTSTGGPAGTDSLPQWKSGLVANNSTWCVIDRGFQLIPVWDLILSNHSKDFKSPYQVSSSLRAAYEALTNQSASPMFGEELVSAMEEARDFMEHVKGWDVMVGEEKLRELINFKQRLNEKTKNHSVWVNVCLSDKALQEFLGNIVGFCKSSPPDNITYIKSLLRCLLDPHIYSVKDFPSSSSIMQWIFHTKKTLPKTPDISELEDLTKTLLQMKDYIQEVTYAPETSASAVHEAKIKATLTASLAIYSLLQCLQERAQKDVELLVLLITTSMGYRVESSTFQYLLGCPEITFMTTEMQTGHQEYLNLKEQDLYRAQAHLLLTGLTVTPEQKAVSPEQKKERLVFMEDHMKNLWSAEITTLLEKHRALKDWEMLESGLQALISGHLDDTCDEAKDDSKAKNLLAEACEKEGLDCAYWLPKLSEKLGVKSREALKHLQYEDYLKLECEVRYPWEKQALQKLLEITEDKGSSEDLQKERLEMTKKRQEEAKQLLEELKEMRKSRNQSEDIRRQKEKALWKAMEIPKEYWPLPEKSLLDVLESIQKQLEQQESSVGRGENVSDTEVLRRASGGLALQGIYKTSRVDDVLAKRDQIIRIPDGFKLTGPEQRSLIERKEFSSSAEEASFSKSMEQLGFSISVCAKAGFWGFNTEDDVHSSNSSWSEATRQSRSEQSYICTTKFQYIPLASCYFQKHQLCLSEAALRELQDIEHLLSIPPEGEESNSMKTRCESFFRTFGSHVNQGPLHFGGIFWWKAATEGFRAEQREEMKQQASKALNSYIGATYSNFTTSVVRNVEVSQSSLQSSVQGRDGKSAHRGVQLCMTSTGGPAGTDSLPPWKSGLVANNSTWCVIDRGFQLIPVWDLILSNHSKDFKSPYQVSSSLRAAYEALTNQSASPMFGEELVSAMEEARDFMEHMKGWDVTVGEEKLRELINFKHHLNEKTKNHSVWVNVCLSDKALQEFLGNIVGFCKSSPPDNITYIKSLLRCLLDPHIYSVKDFPSSSSIMQWIFHTKKTLPETPKVSELEDLTKTLLQMKDYIQEATYAPETSASAVHEAKIKATLTASLAIYSLLQCLQERAQKDVELLVLLITTSMGYRVESSTFQYLLGCPEITFMTTEMQMGHQEYLNLKEQDLYRAQAHLLLTGLTVTPEQKAVSPEQKKERLVFMEDHMKNLWSAEITTLLEKHRALKDWQMLESGLQALISGHLDDTCDEAMKNSIIKDMEDTFQRVEPSSQPKPTPDTGKSNANQAVANQDFLHLLKRLGLENHYPKKMGTEDFHIIYKTSLHDSQPSKDNELPFYFLQKLLTVDYRVRYLTCKDPRPGPNPTGREQETSDSFEDFFSHLEEEAPRPAPGESPVHPMDLQMAIFHCADDFMRQYILTKLAFCQFALPLLVPNPCTSQIEFPIWCLSQIKKSWKGAEKSGTRGTINSYKNKLIYQAETPIVSFIRIGSSPSSSKSQILNALLSKQKHDTFFHRHCKGSTKDCLLMKGLVEISWYCPRGSNDDSFDRCVAFCNLHGDARDHKEQLQFLQEISAVNVAFVSESDQSDKRAMTILRDLWQSQRPLVCLFTEMENVAARRSGQNVKIGMKNRNEAELMEELRKTIRELLEKSNTLFSLDACLDRARKHGFVVDEDTDACVTAKGKAEALVKLLKEKKLSEIKSQLLPLQGKLWYRWCKKDKELTRLQEKRNKSIEHHRSQIESEKSAIRRKQLEKAFPLNQLMKSVLGFLQSQPADSKKYFLQWMKVFMDDLSSDRLDELRREYHQLWSQILAIKKNSEKIDVKPVLMRELEALSSEINDSSIGLEHILREVGQIYEALESTKSKEKYFNKLPEIAAALMVSGYPIELMDGDASYVPLRWVGAIFDSLIEELGDKRVFVLSVLGIQSTGKSTLLNAMFGLQFNVSAGRCTRGAFMQLIKVDEKLQQELDFDYVLVVDTEGLRAIEMANKQSLNHDKELATFVIGIGNMTLINIFGENPSEMQDVLQIAVQAFLRMKQVHLSPSCLFVHQNVGEITAKEQNMEGQRRLQEKLDEMTVIAAQQEFCDVSCFSDVIRFDVNTHIHYFAHLWEGNPPMAPPNPTYSQNVQELKSKILQAAKKEAQGSVLRFSSLKARISDLWNALLNENFIFSFKNSVEIAAYKKLETAFSKWSWDLRSHILDLQMKLDNKIRNGDLQEVTTNYLEKQVQETSDAITKAMEKYFSEDRDCEILVQWKSSTELDLKKLKKSLLLETRKNCENLIELRKNQSELDERKAEYENELLKKSRELALSLKGQKLTEKEMRNKFTSLWAHWISEVSSAAPPLKEVDIDLDIEAVLLDHFKEPKLHERISTFPRCKEFSVDLEKHVAKKKKYLIFDRSIDDADSSTIHRITENIIGCVKANIEKKEKKKRDYSQSFIHEILQEVQKGINSVPDSANYGFNKDYEIDLSLYLCRMAAERFKAMHSAFRKANDPADYLESKREDFFVCFQIFCQGATSVTTFAIFLCDKIAPALRKAVYEKTALAIARDMKGKVPDFSGNRASLEVCLLRYLAEEENFDNFQKYLSSPHDFLWIYTWKRVEEYCSENRRLERFLEDSLTHCYECILSAVSASTKVVKDQIDRNDKISLWLDAFRQELGEVLSLPRRDLKGIEHQEITDIEFLNNAMTEQLSAMKDQLKEELATGDMSSFQRQPHEILAEQFSGCWEQCPFCGALCTNTMPNHDGDHQLLFHRPQVLGGVKWHKTDNLSIDICSSLVTSDCSFRTSEDKWIPYKRYRDAGPPYSTWNILPDTSIQVYWKWFVSHFRADLERWYNGKFQGKGAIPDSWQRITKQEALADLEKRRRVDMKEEPQPLCVLEDYHPMPH